MDDELLAALRCPITREGLTRAPDQLLQHINEAVAAGQVIDRSGDTVAQPIEDALVNESHQWLYIIRGPIPGLVPDEAIAVPTPGEQPATDDHPPEAESKVEP